MIIPMTKKHIELIKQGKKTTTLRSLNQVYDLGRHSIDECHINIVNIFNRQLVAVSSEGIFNIDTTKTLNSSHIAKSEGYRKWDDIVSELESMRHKLPKRMWLYEFEVI